MPRGPGPRKRMHDLVPTPWVPRSGPLLCLAIVCTACGSQDPDSGRGEIIAVDSLKAELLARHPAIGEPTHIQPAQHLLWVADAIGDPFLHLLDPVTGDRTKSLGRRGDGPGEITGPVWGVQVVPPDTAEVWVFDTGRESFLWIGESSTLNSTSPMVRLGDVTYVSRAVWLDSLTIVGTTHHEHERFIFFDEEGRRTKTVPGALLGSDSIPLGERQRATLASGMCAHPEGFGFALFYFDAGRVELYGRDVDGPVLADVPYPSEPVFARIGGKIRLRQDWVHYRACSASKDHLYLLYSGQRTDFNTETPLHLHGREVHVFDWEGRLVRSFHLDTPVGYLGVDEEAGWLYATSFLDAGVYRFRLPARSAP